MSESIEINPNDGWALHKAQVYNNINKLCSRNHIKWIKHCLEELSHLPQEKNHLDLLAELHKKMNNPYMKTAIEAEIEKYPSEWIKNFPIRKRTRETCTSFEEKTVYHLRFIFDQGFFVEKMKDLGKNKPFSELCLSYLMGNIRKKAKEMCGVTTYFSCEGGRLYYELHSEDERERLKSCLKNINDNLDLDSLCSGLSKCTEKNLAKFFEVYNLTKDLENAAPNNNFSVRKSKI